MQFDLSCPSCGAVKNCAFNTLFKSAAVSLSCLSCKRNTSSTKWLCTHAIPWHTCEYHREPGMRCGNKRSKGIGNYVPDRGKAEQRLNNKLRKLGPLGSNEGHCATQSQSHSANQLVRSNCQFRASLSSETRAISAPCSSSRCTHNSTPSHQVKQFLNKKKEEDGSYGEPPTPKRETMRRSQLWNAHLSALTGHNLNIQNRPDHKDMGSEHPRDHRETYPKVRPITREASPRAKKARVEQCASKHARACRGGCPPVWTIEQYCPDCHG